MNRNFINLFLSAAAMFLFAAVADAKLKGMPAVKSYKDYSLRKNSVESVKYTVFAPKMQDSDKPEKGAVADFIVEVFFDEKGYRIKEIVYHIETSNLEAVTDWAYDEKAGTVTEARLDSKGIMSYRTEYLVNYKAASVNMRRFERYVEPNNVIHENVLAEEELWIEDSRKKVATNKKTWFSFSDGIAARQTVREFELVPPSTLYSVMEEATASIDCTWLYDYAANLMKTTSRKSRKEAIFNGESVKYEAKSGLLSKIKTFDSSKVLKNEVIYTYAFDHNKNWTEVVQKENSKTRFIVTRTVRYRK